MREGAAELEELGFGALWIPGGYDGPLLEICADQLGATRQIAVATGILNVFGHDPADVAREQAAIDAAHPGRFLLGIGVGHAKFLPAEAAARSRRPLDVISHYLDELERHAPPGSSPARCVAALAPKMVQLARERTLGVHPYMVPVEHTAEVRAALGDGPLVATELSVVLGDDTGRSARRCASRSCALPAASELHEDLDAARLRRGRPRRRRQRSARRCRVCARIGGADRRARARASRRGRRSRVPAGGHQPADAGRERAAAARGVARARAARQRVRSR